MTGITQDMQGNVCVVTGAARGLGRCISETLAQAGAAQVYACDIDMAPAESWLGGYDNVSAITLNVCDSNALSRLSARLLEEQGRLDVLVNNAGITRDALLGKMTEADWDSVLDVNLKGVFLMTRAMLPLMQIHQSGSIVSISSIVGTDGNIGQSNYAASKGGIISMTRGWAKELVRGGAQIRANCIAPGFINTEMTQAVPQKVLDKMTARIPLGHLGEPTDIAEGVLFLASQRARYITGQVLKIDGGLVL
ncbi:3-oxoacyl-ACP reductase FabG [Oceanimonas baumannii]|uniref:3-oxoacyl-[acyl-carrier protein] reductase n=1 Tax=Oceanimonas baumannii TaxID=129578 RepID=A0A235CEK3_9GAMM|nr:3-oxoacyl-ACP reductase FabG [Oceanimonas baumannii]OYD22866.1 beta-ketoacyl-ACP reductase [Oceanimonas baumannii]TDW56315.1 3-oxoacyl-[acyl-carrier protein] reductase [Oceanimonas baumannii]